MGYLAEYVAYLWLVPVTIFIFIPLLICFYRIILDLFSRLKDGLAPFVQHYMQSKEEEGLLKRLEKRIILNEPVAVELSNEYGKWDGVLKNISRKGLCVEQVADFILDQYGNFTITVEKSLDAIAIQCSLIWFKRNDENNDCGFVLAETNSRWEHYCNKYYN